MHIIHEAFGLDCDLYKTVLQCSREADAAGLRKAYYRRALKYHPDKIATGVEGLSPLRAQTMFQAISQAYQLLKEPCTRACYDETGEIPDSNDDDDEVAGSGSQQWKTYFEGIFGKVTTSGIEAFSAKYKCSDEEKRDVLREFRFRKGNLKKMLEFVILSEPRDAVRWVEDYIRPVLGTELKDVPQNFVQAMESSLTKMKKLVDETTADTICAGEDTETESDDDIPSVLRDNTTRKVPGKRITKSPVKAKPSQAKKKRGKEDMSTLISQIQGRRSAAKSSVSSIGARYGVDDSADPLGAKEFAEIQAKMLKKS